MKKIVMVLLAVALAVSIPTGIALAKTEVKSIEFNNNWAYWQTRPQDSEYVENHSCRLHLEGTIREKGGLKYLSTLTGTIYDKNTNVEYTIQVKPVDASEPLYHWTAGTRDEWRSYVVGNIEGRKTVGILYWPYRGEAHLYLDGVVDGNYVGISSVGSPPTID